MLAMMVLVESACDNADSDIFTGGEGILGRKIDRDVLKLTRALTGFWEIKKAKLRKGLVCWGGVPSVAMVRINTEESLDARPSFGDVIFLSFFFYCASVSFCRFERVFAFIFSLCLLQLVKKPVALTLDVLGYS